MSGKIQWFGEVPETCEVCGKEVDERKEILELETILGEQAWVCGACKKTFRHGVDRLLSGDQEAWDTFSEELKDGIARAAEVGLRVVEGGGDGSRQRDVALRLS